MIPFRYLRIYTTQYSFFIEWPINSIDVLAPSVNGIAFYIILYLIIIMIGGRNNALACTGSTILILRHRYGRLLLNRINRHSSIGLLSSKPYSATSINYVQWLAKSKIDKWLGSKLVLPSKISLCPHFLPGILTILRKYVSKVVNHLHWSTDQ